MRTVRCAWVEAGVLRLRIPEPGLKWAAYDGLSPYILGREVARLAAQDNTPVTAYHVRP
jgi:hypothetical protein